MNVSKHAYTYVYIYICIYIYKCTRSQDTVNIYTYILIYTHKRTVVHRVRCMGVCIYIYICMWTTSSKNFCTGRSTFKKCRSGYSRYGQLPLWPVVPLWLPSWRIESHRSVSMIECQGSSLKSTACAFAVLLDSL